MPHRRRRGIPRPPRTLALAQGRFYGLADAAKRVEIGFDDDIERVLGNLSDEGDDLANHCLGLIESADLRVQTLFVRNLNEPPPSVASGNGAIRRPHLRHQSFPNSASSSSHIVRAS